MGAVTVARMPRAMGTSVGVNDIRTSVRARGLEVLDDLRDVAVQAADRVRHGRTERLRREIGGLKLLARPRVAVGKHRDDVAGINDARRDAWLERERHRGDVAARHRDALHAAELGALASVGGDEFGEAVGPRTCVFAAVVRRPRRRDRTADSPHRSRSRACPPAAARRSPPTCRAAARAPRRRGR